MTFKKIEEGKWISDDGKVIISITEKYGTYKIQKEDLKDFTPTLEEAKNMANTDCRFNQ